jgi:phosphatidylglycerophosphatase A
MNATKDLNPVNPTFSWVRQTASRTVAFGFGSGLSPIAPGTVGTLWAWAAFLLGEYLFSTEDFFWMIGGGALLGCWVCGQVSEELGGKDFGGIVWDEIIAFWIVLIFIMPTPIWMQVIAFGLFRFFDAIKPGPIGMIDRYFKKMERSDHSQSSILQILWRGFGIMVDDLAAAFFTLLVIALIQKIISI